MTKIIVSCSPSLHYGISNNDKSDSQDISVKIKVEFANVNLRVWLCRNVLQVMPPTWAKFQIGTH